MVDDLYFIHNLYRDSSSARGLDNTNSTLNYGPSIKSFITNKSGFDNIQYNKNEGNNHYVFKFGQVDVEYNYYYKLIVKGESVTKDNFYNEVVTKYIKYLLTLGGYNILVCGINLPSPVDFKKYRSVILEIESTHEQIQNLTLEQINNDAIMFNKLLKNRCDLKSDFHGYDHHYRGSQHILDLNRHMLEYNIKYNIDETDYISHPLYKNTYNTFINKLSLHVCSEPKC